MTTMTSFVDEITKIAASSCAARNPKSRSGRRPIRVAKLLKKAQAPVVQAAPGIFGALQRGIPHLAKHKKAIGTVGGTSLGVLGLQRGIEDIRMAEQMRSMQRR